MNGNQDAREVREIALRIGVFFDGTGNNRSNAPGRCEATAEEDGIAVTRLSNVAKLFDRYPGTIGPLPDGTSLVYLRRYVDGIATHPGSEDSSYGWYTGLGDWGVHERVRQASAGLMLQLAAMARQEKVRVRAMTFDLFGFSRGAAAARDFANDLHQAGKSQLAALAGGSSEIFVEGFSWEQDMDVHFIGLFDTVAAIIDPLHGDFSPTNAQNGGLRLGLSPGVAAQVVQLVAGDEWRVNFPLVRSPNDIVLPGCHADLGGGYPLRMRERSYLSKPYISQVESDTPAEDTEAYASAGALLAARYPDCPGYAPTVKVTQEAGCFGGKIVRAQLYREREVFGHLSRVYLEVMHALALAHGVPAGEREADEDCDRLPDELLPISAKLMAFALGKQPTLGLTDEERHLLQARYVHASANWNPAVGVVADLLPGDLLYFNRPAEGARGVLDNQD